MELLRELLKKKKTKTNNELENLYKTPKKDKGENMPKIQAIKRNAVHQADILFLPNDNGYKYLLVIVDVKTGFTDAEPLKTKQTKEIIKAMENIYSRKYLNHPLRLEIDSGSEFKGIEFSRFLDKYKINPRYAKIGRHRQQALVERRNQTIGKVLFMRMTGKELIAEEEENKEWVDIIPKLIELMNKKQNKKNQKKENPSDEILCKGDTCNILEEGIKVRVQLDNPINVITGKRLSGKFRTTDIKWDPEIRTIKHIILKPNSPPLYILNDEYNVAYTKNQLQPVKDNEKAPEGKLLFGDKVPENLRVKNIVSKKKHKNKIYYLISWYGYPDKNDNTWELKNELIKNKGVKRLIEEFEEKQ